MKLKTLEHGAEKVAKMAVPDGVRRIVLTGYMGAGKSTVGRLLAARLGWEFVDLDERIERRAGKSVAAIFAEADESSFRRLESITLASTLGRSNVILAVGGGTPEVLTNRLMLEQTPGTWIVFLDAPFSVVYDRCMLQALSSGECADGASAAQGMRPLLSDPAKAEVRFAARQPIYRRLAQVSVPTADKTPENTVDEVLESVQRSAQGKG